MAQGSNNGFQVFLLFIIGFVVFIVWIIKENVKENERKAANQRHALNNQSTHHRIVSSSNNQRVVSSQNPNSQLHRRTTTTCNSQLYQQTQVNSKLNEANNWNTRNDKPTVDFRQAVLNHIKSNKKTKYYDENDPIDENKLVQNINQCLLTDRVKNAGPIVSSSIENTKTEVKELKEVLFPKEYSYLLSKTQLNEKTLKSEKKLWNIMFSRPKTTGQIIEKEVALICLNWAQAKLDEQIEYFQGSFLSYESHKIVGNDRSIAKFTMKLQLQPKDRRSLRKGAYLMFKSMKEDEWLEIPMLRLREVQDDCATLSTCVYKIDSEDGILMVQRLFYMKNVVVTAYENQPDFIPQSMLRSIERIRSGALNHIITPELKFKTDSETVKKSMKKLLPTIRHKTDLNEHQSQVLYSICTSTHGNAPYILKGPPGTGKTQLIATTVSQLLQMSPNNRVLLTAPSNRAADMLAEKIMDEFDDDGVLGSKNVLRLRSINNDYFGRDRRFDSIVKLDYEMETFVIPEASEFKDFRVVISTLGCSTHIMNRGIPPGFFTHIFLDEAGQASECDIWIPLGGLATRYTSVILCGDHKQLGPVITLNLPLEITKKFESPLVRYMQMLAYQSDMRLFCLLKRSYRCQQSILSIASELFYEKRLLSAIVERHEPFENWSELPNNKRGSIDGNESKDGTSCANEAEIKVVMHYIQKLSKMIKTNEIGVISPYKYQTRLICQEIKKSNIKDSKNITVDSVERFQGSERGAIIMTGTRTSSLGFMADDLRVNTSITRAKNLLIVIGKRSALSNHKSWRLFIEYCEKNNAFIEWDKKCVET